MEHIILIGHGSPRGQANNLDVVGGLLHASLYPGLAENRVTTAYLQFAQPDIASAIQNCAGRGAKRIVLHPFFLSAGMHVTKDIPEIIEEARAAYPGVEFVLTEPLGIHEKLVTVVVDRIREATAVSPLAIERRSFEKIGEELPLDDIPAEQLPIVQRVIHATADFEFRDSLVFHPDAVRAGIAAIQSGKKILTDVEMVRTGISKRRAAAFGVEVLCCLPADTGGEGQADSRTRAARGIAQALATHDDIGIIAVGNAPTALLQAMEIINAGKGGTPPLVVGVPVGFVNAVESKMLLAAQSFPFITNLARKGGTPVAVAVVNALLKMAAEKA